MQYKTQTPIKIQSKFKPFNNMTIEVTHKKPNLFWRFWQYTLLGWKWEDV